MRCAIGDDDLVTMEADKRLMEGRPPTPALIRIFSAYHEAGLAVAAVLRGGEVSRVVLRGTNCQVLGVRLTPNIGTIAVSTVDIQGVYSAIANAIQLVHTTRFQPPEVVVMHPRRWGWFPAMLDNQQRPLFLSDANRPWNAAGILEEVASQQVVGNIQGLPVVTDPNIETTSGAGTEDIVYVLWASDVVLWESGIRARVLPETKAQNLTVLLQLYGYLAFSAARYPQSIVEITGLAGPTF